MSARWLSCFTLKAWDRIRDSLLLRPVLAILLLYRELHGALRSGPRLLACCFIRSQAVTVAALKLAAKLARSVGRPAAREIRPVQGAIIKAASDPNKLTREAVTHFLEAMQGAAPIAGAHAPLASFMCNCHYNHVFITA